MFFCVTFTKCLTKKREEDGNLIECMDSEKFYRCVIRGIKDPRHAINLIYAQENNVR